MASRSVNKVILVGNIGRDAESRQVGESSVASFPVATSRRWKVKGTEDWKEETDWALVTLWRNEGVVPFLLKGTQVYIEGRMQTRSYEDKDGKKVWKTDVVADEVILLGGKGKGGADVPAPAAGASSHDEDDIPF